MLSCVNSLLSFLLFFQKILTSFFKVHLDVCYLMHVTQVKVGRHLIRYLIAQTLLSMPCIIAMSVIIFPF